MGAGAKLKKQMAEMEKDPIFKKCLKRYLRRDAMRMDANFYRNNFAFFLAPLVGKYGFGKKRLMDYMDAYADYVLGLQDFYELYVNDCNSEANKVVAQTGFSLDEWERQYCAKHFPGKNVQISMFGTVKAEKVEEMENNECADCMPDG